METFDPSRPDFAPYGFTCVRWHPTSMQRPDRHNEIELNYLETGWVTYLLGGRKISVRAGQLSAFWAAIPHQIIGYGEEPEYFVATMPLAWFLQCKLPEAFVQSLLRGRVVSQRNTRSNWSDAQLFSDWESDLRKGDVQILKAVHLEMEARLVRLGLAAKLPGNSMRLEDKRHVVLGDGGLNKVEQIACFIAQRYTEKLTVEQIGQAVGLHPNYAMNLFRKAFGTTLIDYLSQHRVSHAQRLLATVDQKIVDVAFASGFGSLSRFNEAFQRACGCSPREYRKRHRVLG